jgi:Tfp pilus assembly protein PilV
VAKKSKKTNQNGFSIIEVLITVFLMIITLWIYQITSQSVAVNRGNRFKEIALRIADKKLENIRTTAYGSMPASGSFSDSMMSSLPNGSGTLTVSDLNAKTKDVKVTVSWTDPSTQATKHVDLETYITQGGIGQ